MHGPARVLAVIYGQKLPMQTSKCGWRPNARTCTGRLGDCTDSALKLTTGGVVGFRGYFGVRCTILAVLLHAQNVAGVPMHGPSRAFLAFWRAEDELPAPGNWPR